MKAYVIKRGDGRYLYTFYIYDNENFGFGELNEAKLFDSVDATSQYLELLKTYYSAYNCNVVEVEIKDLQLNKILYSKTIELIKSIYKTYVCGGSLHIVLDDENVENGDIQWCIENAINQNFEQYYDAKSENYIEEDRLMFLECAENLLEMSMEERLMCIREALDQIQVE
jgi:hypothetical protein